MKILFLITGAVCLACFLKNRLQKPSAGSLLWKTAASGCFLAAAFCGLWHNMMRGAGREFSLLVTAGLFFGLLGDIWLDLKWNCPEEDSRYTFAGFWCFAAGHICFLTAMIVFGGIAMPAAGVVIPLVLAAVLGIAVGMGGKLLALDYGRFKGITMFYGALLIGTVLVSGSFAFRTHFRTPVYLLILIGGVLFLISDLILSGTYFGKGKDRPVDIVSNHIFYYAAQFVIAFAVSVV